MKKYNNKELDLHGVKHEEVTVLVEEFVLRNVPIMKIITGNSPKMQEIVFSVLDRLQCKYFVPTSNTGEIVITDNN